jgi:integrase/recombinase XerD
MKVKGTGQARIFSEIEFRKFRNVVENPSHRLIFDLAWWTGERMGAIGALDVENVYSDPEQRVLHRSITYPAAIRKDRKSRTVLIHPTLELQLQLYQPPPDGFLFPRRRNYWEHLTTRDIDAILRLNLLKLNWSDHGFSTHSFRRSFITRLHRKGTDPIVMQRITGHQSLANLQRYIEVDPKRCDRALLSL